MVTNSSKDREIIDRFKKLQAAFPEQYASAFPDRLAEKTIVIIPSLTLDQEILAKVDGVNHYEERLLCLLMLLRMPNTHVIYVTSMPIHNIIMDYYLHLLPGITNYHARQRLKTISCFDASPRSLTEKILERPRLINRIKKSVPHGHAAHIACFNVTEWERELAVKLNMPIFGCDPDLNYVGTKSFSRKLFKENNVRLPDGFEDLRTEEEIAAALFELQKNNPGVKKAVVKLNDGFSGDGNAIFRYPESPEKLTPETLAKLLVTDLKMVAKDLAHKSFFDKLSQMGGVVEILLDGAEKCGPSVQCRITPLMEIEIVSTHDQTLGGESDQVFLGASFPASEEYAVELGREAMKISEAMVKLGVIGRYSIDFLSIKQGDKWIHYALEINLRKGGTTHPYLMLQFLTDGNYDPENGKYLTATGQQRYYFFTDNLKNDKYKGLTPHDLIEISTANFMMYDGSIQQGVMFHMIGALSQYGKLGVLCIGDSPAKAKQLYEKIIEVLDKEEGLNALREQKDLENLPGK